jgi:C4-dicarboxylate-specific signal transduction histidine kinase
MEIEPEPPAEEIKRLQRGINDLVSILALPAIWIGVEPSKIVRSLLDALIGMLRLDLVYVRLKDPLGTAPIEMARIAGSPTATPPLPEIGAWFDPWLEAGPQQWPARMPNPGGDGELSIVPLRLGLQGEIGIIVAGSQRKDFPGQTEKLILSVAANQAAIGLQGARLLSEQKRVANDLDQRVAQRTKELAAANEELKRSEAFLAEAQRLSSTGSFSWRVATDEITWSEQLYRIFEFDQGKPVTLERIGRRVHPDDIPLLGDMIDRARAGGGDFEYEHRLRMPDGSVKHVHLIAHATRDKDGRLEYIGAAQDVTRRRLSEAALAKARSELAHVARITSLGVLTASIAHEVNQPLAAIVTNGETGLRWLNRPEPNVGKARELTERVVADARRASEIIDRIRAMAAGRAPQQSLLSLDDIVEEALVFLRHEFQSKRTSVSLDLAPALPQVVGDRTQLQQVVVNLAINAVQAMAQSCSARRSIRVRTMPSDPASVCCLIEDSGPGIDPAHLPHLFDTFFTTKDAGMGMGLPISRSIIEAHGGRIRADNDSALGGARFRFELPCQI